MQPAGPSQRAPLGQPVGDYRLGRSLGEGRLGTVYEATHQQSGQRFAVKLLSAALSHTPHVAARFPYEARAVSLVNHASICELREFGVLPDGTAFLVTELLEGETLRARLTQKGRIDESLALTVARQLARALALAHGAEVPHGNLKPENVMLVADPWKPGAERAKTLDLGLLRIASGGGDTAPLVQRVGTPAYLAPEQRAGAGAEPAADVYALGVILYQMLAGQVPFPGGTAEEVAAAQARGAPPLREAADPMVPDEMIRLVERMLSVAPADRPRMQEVAEELDRMDAYKATRAYAAVQVGAPPSRPEAPGRGTLAWAQVVLQQRQAERRKEKDTRSRRHAEQGRGASRRALLGVMAGSMGLALLGGVAFLARRSAQEEPRRPPPEPPRPAPPAAEPPRPEPPKAPEPAAAPPPEERPARGNRRKGKRKEKKERKRRKRAR